MKLTSPYGSFQYEDVVPAIVSVLETKVPAKAFSGRQQLWRDRDVAKVCGWDR